MEKKKWGIIGTGWISHCFAECFSETEKSELAAVSSRTIENAKKFAEEFNIPQYYDSVEEMLDKSDAEIIYIGTPNAAHKKDVLKCINAGKAVLCEKPMPVCKEEAEELANATREKGVFLMEAMWTRFFPVYRKIKEWIDTGRIGKVLSVDAGFCLDNSDADQWRWDLAACGGSLADLGIYPLCFANDMMGCMPIEHKSFFQLRNGLDINDKTLLNYGDDRFAHIASSLYLKTNNVGAIYGEKGMIYVGKQFWRPDYAVLLEDKGDMFVNEEVERIDLPWASTGYQFEADAVSQYVMDGAKESPIMSLDESVEIAGLMQEIRNANGVFYPCDKK